MRNLLVYILKNSEIVLFLYNLYFRVRNKKVFYREIERRKSLSLFDYKELSQSIPYYPIEKVKDSNYYGYAQALKEYAHLDRIDSALEHGIYLGDRVTVAEKYRTTRSVITMSENRVRAFKIHKIQKPIEAIGPYIHYAEPFLSNEDYFKLKAQLGRVLLVMPVHSSKMIEVSFSPKLLIDFIQSVEKDFDTIMVCLHYMDLRKNPSCAAEYEKKGYKVVCAGHAYDTYFVKRLKSIIMLSDYVVSNSHGTNTGFCTYMGKPQTIVHDPDLVKHHSFYTDEVQKIRDEQVKEIENAFSEYKYEISEEQYQVIDKYWGLSCIKTSDELCNALKVLMTKK